MIVDTHVHLNDKRFDFDRQKIIDELPQNNIESVINVGYDIASSRASVSLAESNARVFAAIGVHPHDSKSATNTIYDELAALSKSKKVVAFGEIGLDYFHDFSPREVQRRVFVEQLELAHSFNLPVAIHLRDAYEDMRVTLFENKHLLQNGFVLHCYSGSLEMSKVFLALEGVHFSFGGSLTFKNARRPVEVISFLPHDKILVETDCPYLAPTPFRGQRNEPKYINHVIDKVSEVLSISPQQAVDMTNRNTKALFKRMGEI